MLFFLAFIAMFNFHSTQLKVEDGWMRPAAKGMNSAMYLTIENTSSKADTLVDVTSSLAKIVQIHESYKTNGMMGMRRVYGVAIPAKSTVTFKPGGYHIMFIKMNQDIKAGSKYEVILNFKHAGKLKATVTVQSQK